VAAPKRLSLSARGGAGTDRLADPDAKILFFTRRISFSLDFLLTSEGMGGGGFSLLRSCEPSLSARGLIQVDAGPASSHNLFSRLCFLPRAQRFSFSRCAICSSLPEIGVLYRQSPFKWSFFFYCSPLEHPFSLENILSSLPVFPSELLPSFAPPPPSQN